MGGIWKVEGRGGIWLVHGSARWEGAFPHGEPIPREVAAEHVGGWFAEGGGREQTRTLAAICHALGPFPDRVPPDAGWLRKTVAQALLDRRLTAVRTGLKATMWSVPGEEELKTAKQPVVREETTWIEIVVIDDVTKVPVPGVRLTIKLPGAAKTNHAVPPSGSLNFDPCDAGICEVESDITGATLGNTLELVGRGDPSGQPLRGTIVPNHQNRPFKIAHVVRHQVRTGETLASLAERSGLTWKALARFNFDTEVPKEINQALRSAVGCSHKTTDGRSYVFHDSDKPGTIYIPRKLEERDLATGQTHVFCVRRMAMPARGFLFSA